MIGYAGRILHVDLTIGKTGGTGLGAVMGSKKLKADAKKAMCIRIRTTFTRTCHEN